MEMTDSEFANRLDVLVDDFNKEVVKLVHEARERNGLSIDTIKPISFAKDFLWQDAADRIVCIGGWIFDRLNGRNRLHRNSMTKKLRKVLGYTNP